MGMGGAQAVVQIPFMGVVVGDARLVQMAVDMIVIRMDVAVGVGVPVAVDSPVGVDMLVVMVMEVVVGMFVGVIVALDPGFAFTASAYRAHVRFSEIYSTSRSLTRISVPPVAWTW